MNGQKLVLSQTERQLQKLSPQQVLNVRILELPITELEQRVKDEVIDNVALEEKKKDSDDDNLDSEQGTATNDEYDSVLYDEYDDGGEFHQQSYNGQQYDLPIGDTKSFADDLEAQIAEYNLTGKQLELIEYLIGSLNDKGFIDTSLNKISDDLLIKFNIDASIDELEEVLKVLQEFDPPGIGARNLKESLVIQLQKIELPEQSIQAKTRQLAILIVERMYDDMLLKRYGVIAKKLKSTEEDVKTAVAMIGRMNPAPGRPLNEEANDRKKFVIPDVIISTDNEQITWVVNDGDVPELEVSTDYKEQLQIYQKQQDKVNVQMREAYSYMKQKVESAGMLINAIAQRKHTLSVVTQALVSIQRDFLLSQDINDLKPMTLNDIAQRAGVDISTVSRVKSSKYIQLDGRTYSFSHFFIRTRQNAHGEVVVGNDVNSKIKSIIDNETKEHPYADDEIVKILEKQGLNISRRTVAKYRSNLGYPIATRRRG